MSKENNSQNKIILDRLILALDTVGLPKHGRGVALTKCTGYSSGQLSAILNNKVALNDRFTKSVCKEYLINEKWLDTGEGEMFSQTAVSDPASSYGVTAVHRTLTPDQERALQLLENDPDGYKLLERFMLLEGESEKLIIRGEIEKLVRERQRIRNSGGQE